MAILGLILFVAAVGTGVELAVSNRAAVGGEAFGYTIASASPMAFLIVGALLTLVATLGMFMITGALERRRHRHLAAKHRVRETVDTNEALVEENEELRNELLTERRQRDTLGGVAVPPGTGDVAYADQISDAVRSNTISDTGRYEPYPAEPVARLDTDTDVEVETERVARRRR